MGSKDASTPSLIHDLLKQHSIDLHDYIGKGAYSSVRLAFNNKLGRQVAIKSIDTSSRSEYVKRFLPRELLVVQALDHPNIVHVYQILHVEKSRVLIIEEYGENGDLLKKIKRETKVNEQEGRLIFRQLIAALEYLKSKSIVHRDVKCENVFLDACDNVKLGDFGFARFLRDDEQVSNTFCGSRAYVAPEILTGTTYNGFTVDVWSAGVVLYIMVTGVMPYDDRKPRKMLERMEAHRVRFPRMPLSLEVRTLIYDILHPSPASRPTYAQICTSPWLAHTPYVMRTARVEVASESEPEGEED